jgi:hypothetical protein
MLKHSKKLIAVEKLMHGAGLIEDRTASSRLLVAPKTNKSFLSFY